MFVEDYYETEIKHKETKIRMTEDRLLRAHKNRDSVDEALAQKRLLEMRNELQQLKWERAQI